MMEFLSGNQTGTHTLQTSLHNLGLLLSRLRQDWLPIFCFFIIGNLIYGAGLVVYRLFFSPISHFPGPKLAAVTQWVEIWYDVFLGGKFTQKIESWHEQYGRVVRISPFEISIADAEFHEILYAPDSKFIKVDEMKNRLGIGESTFETVSHEHHKMRRSALNAFFSRQSILKLNDHIQDRTNRICTRLQEEWKGTGKPFSVNDFWAALTVDTVFYFAFAWDDKYVEAPDFVAPFPRAIWHQVRSMHAMGHFPWLRRSLELLPRSLVVLLYPTIQPVFDFHDGLGVEVEKIRSGQNTGYESAKHRTVFHEVLDSKLPTHEKSELRLRHEASSVVGAGIDTTKHALSLATFFILNDPAVHKKLREELAEAIPDANVIPPLPKLETLPYLDAVVQEALRMSMGIAQRLTRISHDKPVKYDGWVIPAGFRFGMSAYMTLRDPRIFPNPDEFIPDRWLNDPRSFSGRSLSQYHVAFGKGPRMCVGINLAKAEIYIGLATLFRRVKLRLHETTKKDVMMDAEYFIPLPPADSLGVRCTVE